MEGTSDIIIVDCTWCRYGQLSGMVEPLAGIFGAAAVVVSIINFDKENNWLMGILVHTQVFRILCH